MNHMIGSVDDFHRRVASIHTMYLIIIWGQGECNQPHWRSSGVSSLVSSAFLLTADVSFFSGEIFTHIFFLREGERTDHLAQTDDDQ